MVFKTFSLDPFVKLKYFNFINSILLHNKLIYNLNKNKAGFRVVGTKLCNIVGIEKPYHLATLNI